MMNRSIKWLTGFAVVVVVFGIMAARLSAGEEKPKPKVINVKCPIMGGKVDPEKVAQKLTREFKEQKIGFCCGMCPMKWDKLTDEQKQAKLEKLKKEAATEKPKDGHEGHKH